MAEDSMNERGFNMLAGTVLTDRSIVDMQRLLVKSGLPAEIECDELKVKGPAMVYFRPGFAHELILVGDAQQQAPLLTWIEQISAALRAHGIQHAYEIYDTDNQSIHDYRFQP